MPENRMAPLRIGLVGSGWVSEVCHLPALRDIGEAEVVALADIDGERLRRMADLYGIERRYADYRELVVDPQVEAVAVCVPSRRHLEVALAALDADKHVFLEKPLTANLDECDRLIDRAARSTKTIMVGFNMRWHHLIRRMRETVASGKLDPIQSMWTAFTSDTFEKPNVPEWRKRRELGGGALIEQAIHHFDLWRHLLQTEVEQVFAASGSIEWDDETAAVTARMANGVVVSSLFSEVSSNNNEIEVCGRQGRLHLSSYCFDGLEFYSIPESPGSLRSRLARMKRFVRELPRGVAKLRQGGEFMFTYRTMWRHFAQAVRNGGPVDCTLEDARRTLQVLLAVVESASRGQPVVVENASRSIAPIAGR